MSTKAPATAHPPGSLLTVTDTGAQVVIWSQAPGPGQYWAHLLPDADVVLISVRHVRTSPLPIVKVEEYW